jgi:hypothetical protein
MAAALHERMGHLRQQRGGADLWGPLPKQHLVMQLLERCCVQQGQRLVVFSEGLQPLEDLQQLVRQRLGWALGQEFLVLDGETPARRRQRDIARFQDESSKVRLYFISTRAGGVGINLFRAHRLLLLDVPWNPVHNAQVAASRLAFGTRPGLAPPAHFHPLPAVQYAEGRGPLRVAHRRGLRAAYPAALQP